MNRTHALSCSILASGLLAASALAQTYVPLPFEDNFSNGVQPDSDSVTNFWNSFSVGSQGGVQEADGNWVI
ncbi:MAG: hypothetical protein U1E27_09205, partial [Kiritimatiellia bacterium]|nr:hypothetical protein [Kiritimatiellia bacterium]